METNLKTYIDDIPTILHHIPWKLRMTLAEAHYLLATAGREKASWIHFHHFPGDSIHFHAIS